MTDTAAAAPVLPTPAPAPTDVITADPTVTYADGVGFTITGRASSTAGVTGVTVSALVDGKRRRYLGAATLNPDGSFSFTDRVGSNLQNFIFTAETDGAGGSASTNTYFQLQAGIRDKPYVAVQNSYDPATEAFTGQTFFAPDGSVVYTSNYQDNGDGTVTYRYSGGSFFDGKLYSSFADTFAISGTLLSQTRYRNDGSNAGGTDLTQDQIPAGPPMLAGAGDATLQAPDGDITMVAGTGNDTFNGGWGNDTFVYASADGNLAVNDHDGWWQADRSNTLELTDSNSADVTLSRTPANDLLLTVNATGNTITIPGTFNSATHDGIQQIAFADGTTWTRDQITAAAPIRAGAGDATLQAPDGDITIMAGAGSDTFTGGWGNDTFVYASADGNLAVNDHDGWWQADRSNTLELTDLNIADLTLSRTPTNDLILTVNTTGNIITIPGTFNSATHDGVQRIAFADGTTWNQGQIAANAPVRAGVGDATLQAPDGDITMVAGAGNDTFTGGWGNDTFVYASADGNLAVNDHDGWWQTDRDNTLRLADINPGDVTLSRTPANDLVLTVNATGNTITIPGTFNSATHDGIQQIAFADGTTWNQGQIAANAPVRAGASDATLQAPDGDITMVAGAGSDTFTGGWGNDTFVYASADGNLTVNDHDGWWQAARSNTLQLSDLNTADLSFAQQNNDLVIAIAGTGRAITIAGEFNSADHDGVQSFKFADGSQLSRSDILAKLHQPS